MNEKKAKFVCSTNEAVHESSRIVRTNRKITDINHNL